MTEESILTRQWNIRGSQRVADSAIFLFLLLFAATYMSVLVPAEFTVSTTPDSLAYLDAARNIAEGHGMVLTNFVYGADSAFEPIMTWPPLYPLILSLFPGAEDNIFLAAFLCSIVLLALNCFITFLIARRMLSPRLSLVAVFLFAISSGNQVIMAHVWSEPLFITTILFSSYFSLKVHEAEKTGDGKQVMLFLSLMALALAGSFYTRYIGFLFAFLVPLTWLYSSNRRHYFPHHFAGAGIYVLISAALVLRNYTLGDATGGDMYDAPRQASEDGISKNLVDVLDSLQFLIPDKMPLAGAFLLVAVIHFLSRSGNGMHAVPVRAESGNFNVASSCITILGYLIGLILLRSLVNFEEIRIRYTAVISPYLMILLVYWAARLSQKANLSAVYSVLAATALVLVFVKSSMVYYDASQNREKFGEPRYPVRQHGNGAYSDLTSPSQRNNIFRLVEGLGVEDSDVVITERPELYAFVSGHNFMRLEGGVHAGSLASLSQQHVTGFLFLTQEGTKKTAAEYLGFDFQTVSSNNLVIPLPLPKP